MLLENLGNIGEFLGAVGVIVSLVYLAAQIRQNTRTVRASSHHVVNDSFGSFLRLLVENERAADIFARGVGGLDGLEDDERDTFYTLCSMLFTHFDNAHLHYRSDLIEESQWQRWRIAIGWYVGFPGVHTWWSNRRGVYAEEFRELVEEEHRRAGATDTSEWAPARTHPGLTTF